MGTVGGIANTALQPGGLLSSTVNTLGQTLQRTVDRTGNIVERTLDTAGTVVNQRTVGNVSSLSVLRETTGAAGQVIRQVRDTTGAVIELTLDSAGKVTNSRVISQATGTTRTKKQGTAANESPIDSGAVNVPQGSETSPALSVEKFRERIIVRRRKLISPREFQSSYGINAFSRNFPPRMAGYFQSSLGHKSILPLVRAARV